MYVADLIASLKARWRLLAVIVLAVWLAVVGWTLMSTRYYVAQSSLLFEDQGADPIPGADGQRQSLIGTQADIIKSDAVAAQVVRDQHLANDPATMERWRKATGGIGDPAAWLGHALSTGLLVAPGLNSNVLVLQYRSRDPVFAALMANAFASTFISERLGLQLDPAKAYASWFKGQTADVRKQLEDAQNRLVDFQRQKGIIDDATLNAENVRYSGLLNQLGQAEAGSVDAKARAAQGTASGAVQDNAIVSGLRSDYARQQTQLSNMLTVYGPNHPAVVAARASLDSTRQKLGEAQGTALGTVGAAKAASNVQEGDLRGLVDKEKARILSLTSDRAQMSVLQKDVESARAAYDSITQRLAASRLESELPRGNVRQLDEASPPSLPVDPNVPLRLFLGLVVGAMLALTVGVILEWMRPLVRTAEGVERMTGIPVVTKFTLSSSAVAPLFKGASA